MLGAMLTESRGGVGVELQEITKDPKARGVYGERR
jgi:hypothetical protein